jgi:DNA-binding transcriptional MerR regulator
MSTSAALPELTGLDDDDLLIGDVARLSGLSIDTLHYYDRAGLLGAVHRDGGGRRVFDRDALGLLDVVLRLRRTGMPVKQVRHFDLVGSGDAERAGRLDLLRAHRRRVLAQLDELHDDLAVIEWKRRLSGRRGRHRAAAATARLAEAAPPATTAGQFVR